MRLLRERERGRTVKKGGEEKGLTNGGVPILKKFASVLVLDPIGFHFSSGFRIMVSFLFLCFFVFSNVRISGNLNSENRRLRICLFSPQKKKKKPAYVKYRICPLMGFFFNFFLGVGGWGFVYSS